MSLLLFVVGASLLYHGLRVEGSQAYLVIIFPVIVLSGPFSLLGTLLIFMSVFLGFLSLAGFFPGGVSGIPGAVKEVPYSREPPARPESRTRWGGVLLLGPVPIVFGSDVKVTTAMLVLGIVLTIALIFLFL